MLIKASAWIMKLFSPEARATYMALCLKAECLQEDASVCLCDCVWVQVNACDCIHFNVWMSQHMDIKGQYTKKISKAQILLSKGGGSSIKQILLPEGWPSRSVGMETPVAALRASGSVRRHRAGGVAAQATSTKRSREMTQFGIMFSFYQQSLKSKHWNHL